MKKASSLVKICSYFSIKRPWFQGMQNGKSMTGSASKRAAFGNIRIAFYARI